MRVFHNKVILPIYLASNYYMLRSIWSSLGNNLTMTWYLLSPVNKRCFYCSTKRKSFTLHLSTDWSRLCARFTTSPYQCLITTRNEVGARLYFHRHLWFCPQGWCLFPGGLLRGVPAPGGVPGPRGVPSPGGVPGPGGAWWSPPPPRPTAAGGTHPTGMHSGLSLRKFKDIMKNSEEFTRWL